MKASYLQMNHLSRMLKPGGKEGDVSLKSNLDGERLGTMYAGVIARQNIC